jgi:hypothetical protein
MSRPLLLLTILLLSFAHFSFALEGNDVEKDALVVHAPSLPLVNALTAICKSKQESATPDCPTGIRNGKDNATQVKTWSKSFTISFRVGVTETLFRICPTSACLAKIPGPQPTEPGLAHKLRELELIQLRLLLETEP